MLRGDVNAAAAAARTQWASLPGSPHGQPTRGASEFEKVYNEALAKCQGQLSTFRDKRQCPSSNEGAIKMLIVSLTLLGWLILLGCAASTPTTPPSGAPSTSTMSPKVTPSPILAPTPQQPSHVEPREQTIFGAEEEITHPASLPEDVLQILRRDERNRRRLAGGQTPDDMPASWFAASRVRLNDDDLPDLVVMAANPRLWGANIVPFWVFRSTPRGHELVLKVMTLGLEILRTKTNGYRDIRTTEVAAGKVTNTVYSFDGAEYQARRSSQEPIR